VFSQNQNFIIFQVDISKATMMCKLMESLMKLHSAVDLKEMKTSVKSFLCHSFIFAYIWSVGGNIVDNSREMFEVFIRSQFEEHPDAW
jgi:dynein heavy chain